MRLVYLTVIKGVGELRYNTFTITRSNACFLVGIRIVYTMFFQCQPLSAWFLHKTQIFLSFYTKNRLNSIKLHQISKNQYRLSLIGWIELYWVLCLTQSGIFLTPRTPTHQTDRFALSTKTRQHLRHVYNLIISK